MRRFGVVGLPTLVWIDRAGQRAGSIVGFVGRSQLLDWAHRTSAARSDAE